MISYPISEISQTLSSPSNTTTSFVSVIPSSSCNILHADRHKIYNNKAKESTSLKKHKKSFRTAKFLFPVHLNMTSSFQYPPIMPQLSCKIVNNIYDPTPLNQPSYPCHNAHKSYKCIKSSYHVDSQKCEGYASKKANKAQNLDFHDDDSYTSENESKHLIDSSFNSQNQNFENQTNLNENNSTFDIDLQSSPNPTEMYKIDISNTCFDIVKRGNFPSILVKDGYVEIIQ